MQIIDSVNYVYVDKEVKQELLERGFINECDMDIELSSDRLQEIKQSIRDLYKRLEGSSVMAKYVTYKD